MSVNEVTLAVDRLAKRHGCVVVEKLIVIFESIICLQN